jgi:protein-S-isoprenylcysteine O-methyltransferase Ste14
MSQDTRIVIRLILGFIFISAFLFVPAGTIRWIEAWIYIIIQFSASISIGLWLRKNDPELLKDRMEVMKKTVRGWDKALQLSMTPFFIALLVIPGLEVVRYNWTYIPTEMKLVGFIALFLSLTIFFLVIRENTILSRVVEIQQDKGHRVIMTGPYKYIRHPMYVAVCVMFFAIPLALGSLYGMIPAFFLAVALIIRTFFEDKILHKELDGYVEYAKKTRYRLLPGIW